MHNDMVFKTVVVIPFDTLKFIKQCGDYALKMMKGSTGTDDRPQLKLEVDGRIYQARLLTMRISHHWSHLYITGELSGTETFIAKVITIRTQPPQLVQGIGSLSTGCDMDAMAMNFADRFDTLASEAWNAHITEAFRVLEEY